MIDFDSIRKQYDIKAMCHSTSSKSNIVIVCPLPNHSHSNGTPSFSIFTDYSGVQRFKCHGSCGLYGDVIDFYGYMNIPMYDCKSWKNRVSAAKSMSNISPSPISVSSPVTRIIDQNIYKTYIPIHRSAKSYIEGRGVANWQVSVYNIGGNSRSISIPSFVNGQLLGVKLRSISRSSNLRYWSVKGSKCSLFGYDKARKKPKVVITKGEIAAMVVERYMIEFSIYDIGVCSPTGGESSWKDEWVHMLSGKQCIYIGDNDHNPCTRFDMVSAAVRRANKLGAKLVFPPNEYKDVDEWVVSSPYHSIRTIQSWLN